MGSKYWLDCGLREGDVILTHYFKSETLNYLFNLDVDNRVNLDQISAIQISNFVLGCFNRNVNKISLHWNVYGNIIYVLTGILFCKKIIIKFGSATNKNEIYKIPKVFLSNGLDNLEIKFNKDIQIFIKDEKVHDEKMLRNFSLNNELIYFNELDIFKYRLSSLCQYIDNEPEKNVLNKIKPFYKVKKLKLIEDSDLKNFIISQACIYIIEGDCTFEKIIKTIPLNVIKSNFDLHERVLNNAFCIACIFNSLYKYKSILQYGERIESDLKNVILEYYEQFIDLNNNVIMYAIKIISIFNNTFDINATIDFAKQIIKIDAPVNIDDVIKILKI